MAMFDTPETLKANRRYIRRAMQAPVLTREHELDLARRWRVEHDERALHELVTAYMRLVIAMASRFRNYGLPMGDVVQEGNIGLMQAAERFDPAREVRFSTYAAWWIRAAIQGYVLRNWSIVRTGTTAAQKSLFFNLRRLRAKIDGGDGQMSEESRRRTAEELGVSIADVRMMEARLAGHDRSLNAPIGEDGEYEAVDMLSDDRAGPEEVVVALRDNETRAQWLNEALRSLTPRERTIIEQRRLAEESVTLESLGSSLGISKERVRQIEAAALRKLRSELERQAGSADSAVFVA